MRLARHSFLDEYLKYLYVAVPILTLFFVLIFRLVVLNKIGMNSLTRNRTLFLFCNEAPLEEQLMNVLTSQTYTDEADGILTCNNNKYGCKVYKIKVIICF